MENKQIIKNSIKLNINTIKAITYFAQHSKNKLYIEKLHFLLYRYDKKYAETFGTKILNDVFIYENGFIKSNTLEELLEILNFSEFVKYKSDNLDKYIKINFSIRKEMFNEKEKQILRQIIKKYDNYTLNKIRKEIKKEFAESGNKLGEKPFYQKELEHIKKEWEKTYPERVKIFTEQYLKWGFSDKDTFNLDIHLTKLILPRLKRYRELAKNAIRINFPLDEIIEGFEAYEEVGYDAWQLKGEKLAKFQKGLKLFAENFLKLWW